MRRRLMDNSNESNTDLCNVLLHDKLSGLIFSTPNMLLFSPDKYEPLGVVVVQLPCTCWLSVIFVVIEDQPLSVMIWLDA